MFNVLSFTILRDSVTQIPCVLPLTYEDLPGVKTAVGNELSVCLAVDKRIFFPHIVFNMFVFCFSKS